MPFFHFANKYHRHTVKGTGYKCPKCDHVAETLYKLREHKRDNHAY